MKFVADSMLGRLATWLRVLGYDTHYQSHYSSGVLGTLIQQHRRLVTRDRTRWTRSPDAVFLHFDRAGEQLKELLDQLHLRPDPSRCFTRCLRCNAVLEAAGRKEALERVPEYVFYANTGKIKACRSCGRYFWPGSHRERMVKQLITWNIVNGENQLWLDLKFPKHIIE